MARSTAPEYFADLNLDQFVDAVTQGHEEYDLGPVFSTPLHEVEAVARRHEVFQDLDATPILEAVERFAQGMRTVRDCLAWSQKLRYRYQKERWFLDAAMAYADAVQSFGVELSCSDIASRGMLAMRRHFAAYAGSREFRTLVEDASRVRAGLDAITYCTNVRGLRVDVSEYRGEPDYSEEVLATFAKFAQGSVERHLFALGDSPNMNHVEERIHDLIVELLPEQFAALDAFCAQHRDFLDPIIVTFDREIQFYVSYLECIAPLQRAGLPFCYPTCSRQLKRERASGAFDLALALRLVGTDARMVCNDFELDGPERIMVVTGPNQGGKTTFARMYAQLHHLAGLGCPVPGSAVTVHLPDQIFTHFEKEEDPAAPVGKLEDDLLRVHDIFERMTSDSVVILNEVFNSTTLHDASFLGRKVLAEISRRDALCVCVTFVDELASLNDRTVSMVGLVDPDDVERRTYEIVRRPADGLAHALALAEKYGLTRARLEERIAS